MEISKKINCFETNNYTTLKENENEAYKIA
jgi:hypothetical protein